MDRVSVLGEDFEARGLSGVFEEADPLFEEHEPALEDHEGCPHDAERLALFHLVVREFSPERLQLLAEDLPEEDLKEVEWSVHRSGSATRVSRRVLFAHPRGSLARRVRAPQLRRP